MQFEITGLSSGKTKQITIGPSDQAKSMLNFLRENHIGIASSCRGEGICNLCIINRNILSCEITVAEFTKKHGYSVSVSYL